MCVLLVSLFLIWYLQYLIIYVFISGFLSSMNQTILEYAMNVDVHYNNKLCENTLNTARTIMKQDLHDTVEMHPQVIFFYIYHFFKDLL